MKERKPIAPRLKKWLKENGKNKIGEVMENNAKFIPIPLLGGVIEQMGRDLQDDPELTPEQKLQIAEAVKADLKELEIIESNLTERHKNDMLSDSWLSKNVRPIVVLNFTALIDFMIIMATFDRPLKEQYIGLIMTLGVTVLGGYFAIRSVEKRNKQKYK